MYLGKPLGPKVLYTYSERDGVEEIKSVELAKEVTGTVTKVKNDSKDESNSGLTLAGTEYKAANIMAKSLLSAISVNLDYTAYIDAYGYVISVSEEDYKDYALVLEIEGEYQAGFKTNRAKLLFTDGTTATVNLAKDYKNKGVAQNEIVTYKADNGVYTLKEVKKTQKSVDVTNFVMENGKATINTNTGDVNSVATVYGNSKTMFVVKNVADRDYTAYTGIKNAPTVKSAAITGGKVSAYWYCKSGDIVTAMFVLPESDLQVTDENNNLLFLAKESVSKLIHDSVGDYYEYQAVVNGKIETVKVDWKVVKDSTVQTTEQSGKLNGLFSKYSKDTTFKVTKIKDLSGTFTAPTVTFAEAKDVQNSGKWDTDDTLKLNLTGNVTAAVIDGGFSTNVVNATATTNTETVKTWVELKLTEAVAIGSKEAAQIKLTVTDDETGITKDYTCKIEFTAVGNDNNGASVKLNAVV